MARYRYSTKILRPFNELLLQTLAVLREECLVRPVAQMSGRLTLGLSMRMTTLKAVMGTVLSQYNKTLEWFHLMDTQLTLVIT
jgi:hypothetical protein